MSCLGGGFLRGNFFCLQQLANLNAECVEIALFLRQCGGSECIKIRNIGVVRRGAPRLYDYNSV